MSKFSAGLSDYEAFEKNSSISMGNTTVLNAQLPAGFAMPGYLECNYDRDIRIEKIIKKGGEGIIYFGVLISPELRQKHLNYADAIVKCNQEKSTEKRISNRSFPSLSTRSGCYELLCLPSQYCQDHWIYSQS